MNFEDYDLGVIYELSDDSAEIVRICFINSNNGKILRSDKFINDYSIIKNDKLYLGSNKKEAIRIIKNSGDNDFIKSFSNVLGALVWAPKLTQVDLGVFEVETSNNSNIKKNSFLERLLLEEVRSIIFEGKQVSQEPRINVVRSNGKVNPNYNALDLINSIKSVVIGQDSAVERIVTNTLLNQKLIDLNDPYTLKSSKSTILIDGPSGVGKTLTTEELSKMIKIPMTVTSSTNFSGVGYVDDSLSSNLIDLLNKTNGNLQKAQRGIIFFDEVDKLGDSDLEMRKAIMQELLTWLNGTKIKIKYNGKSMTFDTTNITFVFAGAFTRMREVNKNSRSIGFNQEDKNSKRQEFKTEDYIKFGMEKEFMARISCLITLQNLTKENLKDILLYSKVSPLLALSNIFKCYDAEISYTEEFIDRASEDAFRDNCGARSLQKIINSLRDKLLLPLMSGNISSITLTEDMLDSNYEFEFDDEKKLTL